MNNYRVGQNEDDQQLYLHNYKVRYPFRRVSTYNKVAHTALYFIYPADGHPLSTYTTSTYLYLSVDHQEAL